MKDKIKQTLSIVVIVLALGLSGCITVQPDTTPTPQKSTPTPTPTYTPYTPPPSTLTAAEQEFIDDFEIVGYTISDEENIINSGREICKDLDEYSVNSVVSVYFEGLTKKQEDKMSALFASAVVNLCPRHESTFE